MDKPNEAIINRLIKSGAKLTPGMVPPKAVPDSDQHSEEEEEKEEEEEQEEPTSNEAMINSNIESDAQLLPGTGPSSSVPDSDQQSKEEEQDNDDLMKWWISEEPWKKLEDLNTEKDKKASKQNVKDLVRALYVFECFLDEQGPILQNHIKELQKLSYSADKDAKRASIAGASVGALGLTAAAGMYIFAALPKNPYLAVAAIGAGIAVAVFNKIHSDAGRKQVETVLKEYSTIIEKIEICVKYIRSVVECLKKYDLPALKLVRVAKLIQLAEECAGAIGPLSKSSGLIQSFTLGIDIHFSEHDYNQMKKGSETKFTRQIHILAMKMQASLDDLMSFKTVVESADI